MGTFSVSKPTFCKGEHVLHVSGKKIGVIDYGPDSDGDYKVKFEDGERSGYVKAAGLRGSVFIIKKSTLHKGEVVLHVSEKKIGVIDYGPDSDGDYKVKFEDGERSGYVQADGLRGCSY